MSTPLTDTEQLARRRFKIVDDGQIQQYRLMKAEGFERRSGKYNRYKFGDQIFAPVTVMDMPGYLAIVDDKSHVGEYVELIYQD